MLDRIKNDLIASMKSGNKERVKTLRMITSAIKQIEVDKRDIIITEDIVISVLNKMLKQRQESILAFTNAKRVDLVEIEEKELDVIKEFLPVQLSIEEAKMIIEDVLTCNNITTKTDLGKAMTLLKTQLNGKTDMKFVSEYVRTILV